MEALMVAGGQKTRHDYEEPGSFERLLEAAIALADADSDGSDEDYHRAKCRLRKAARDYVRHHGSRETRANSGSKLGCG